MIKAIKNIEIRFRVISRRPSTLSIISSLETNGYSTKRIYKITQTSEKIKLLTLKKSSEFFEKYKLVTTARASMPDIDLLFYFKEFSIILPILYR